MTEPKFDIPALLAEARKQNEWLKAFECFADYKPTEIGDRSGPLAGIPFGVKDLIDTVDLPTCYGSKAYREHRPVQDAAIVATLKQAGAIVFGKTATTEFATHPPAQTRNPVNMRYTPGGSSAGSAAAVACELVPIALGTQTLGSVIRPASYCGTVGFKPSYGWFRLDGVKSLAPGLDTLGFLARRLEYADAFYRVASGNRDRVEHKVPRLCFISDPDWTDVSPDAEEALSFYVDSMRRSGFDVVEVASPEGFGQLHAAANVLHDYEMHSSLWPDVVAYRELIDPTLVKRIEEAAGISKPAYEQATALVREERGEFDVFMRNHDAVLCVAATGEPPESLLTTGDAGMNAVWTALHLPCITLPKLKGRNGMPIGLQLIGRYGKDASLLSIAAQLDICV